MDSISYSWNVFYKTLMVMHYDNQVATYIVNNRVFHEDMAMQHRIVTSFVTFSLQLGGIFTEKVLSRKSFSLHYNKEGMIDIYAPT